MATFTLPLWKVISSSGGVLTKVDGLSVMTGGDIGLNNYPIFDSDYRAHLNGRIIDHYMNREIGQETVDMFNLAMRRKMNEIMPYYNLMYLSTRITFDPLSTININTVTTGDTTQSGTTSGTNDATTTATGASRTVGSDTPQTMLSGDGDYASSAADVNSASSNTATATNTGTESNTINAGNDSTTTGYQGAVSDLIMRYRESLINVDLAVIDNLEECFMQIWDNGDSYYSQNERLFL
jgi:hypothetical protein